jgi:hypothetical protein
MSWHVRLACRSNVGVDDAALVIPMSEQPCTVAHDPQARGSTLTPNGTNGNGVPFSNRAFFSKPHVYVLHSSFEDTMGYLQEPDIVLLSG